MACSSRAPIWSSRFTCSRVGKSEQVAPSIGLYFTDDPPERTPVMLGSDGRTSTFRPGDNHYVVDDSFVLPVDVELQALQPHAHYRAREVEAVATLPDGTRRWLINIKSGISGGSTSTGLSRRSRFRTARRSRCTTRTTTRPRISAILSSLRCMSSGDSSRGTRWATSGSRS